MLTLIVSTACVVAQRVVTLPPTGPVREVSLDRALRAYDDYCNGLRTLSASGDVALLDRKAARSRSLGIRLVAQRGGQFYLKGSVAVVTALEVVSDGVRFWFEVPSKKTIWTGLSDAHARAEVGDAPYDALRPRDVTFALLPEPFGGSSGFLLLEADRESVSVALANSTGARGTVRRRVWLDRVSLHPIRLRQYDEKGELQTEAQLTNWIADAPHRVHIERPIQGYEATFVLDRVQTNVPIPPQAFAPRTPAGYAVVEVSGS